MQFVSNTSPRCRCHDGATSLEVMVAFTLLTSVLSFSVPLIVRHGRLLTCHNHYRLALDELSNHLDRLTALPEAERAEALENLAPSPFAAARLPGVELRYELEPLDIGQRLILFVTWDEPQRRRAPVTMAAWVHPDRKPSSDETGEDGKP